jgi:uncharacterized protein with GYD domain
MFHGSYTAAGGVGVLKDGGTGRMNAVKATVESVGGTLETIYWALGKDDFYLVADLPDSHAAAALSLAVASTGAVTVTTAELFTAADVDDIVSRRANYRAPGA